MVMEKIKLGVICGGMSTENEVSVISASSILKNLNEEKYEVFPIYIDKNGDWYKWHAVEDIKLGEEIKNKEKIENIITYLKRVRCSISSITWIIWRRSEQFKDYLNY